MKEMRFPVTFMDVETLANRWKCGISTIQMLAETEQIKLCIRPVALEIALEQFQIEGNLFEALCKTPLSRRDICRVFKEKHPKVQTPISNTTQTPITIYVDSRDLHEVKTGRKTSMPGTFLLKLQSGGLAIAQRKHKEIEILYHIKNFAYMPERLNMIEVGEETALTEIPRLFSENLQQVM